MFHLILDLCSMHDFVITTELLQNEFLGGGGGGGEGGGEGVANHTKGYHTKSFSVLNNSVMETVFRNVSVTTQSRPQRTLTTF